ncbi:hypothetical protein [Vagococcus carniphilus]|uniref:hypothetical protein n=1 Tax=Vagococcus carniphilus TaxID=218144 RepID=UPI003B59A2D6
MKKKIIITSILGLIGIFLVAGTITLASTTNQNRSESTVSAKENKPIRNDENSYCQREGHQMNGDSYRCDGPKKGYHNENCDYYEELKEEDSSKEENFSRRRGSCHDDNGSGRGRHRNSGRHMRMNNY